MVIDDVSISYWEDSSKESKNNTIQPVYKFTGKSYDGEKLLGEFTALESVME